MPSKKDLEIQVDPEIQTLFALRDAILHYIDQEDHLASGDAPGPVDPEASALAWRQVAELAELARPEADNDDSETGVGETMMRRARKFVALERRKATLKAETKRIGEQLEHLGGAEGVLLLDMQNAGTTKMTVDGKTIFFRKDVWVKLKEGVDKATACEALKASGFGRLVKTDWNANSLRGVYTEAQKTGQEIPDAFFEAFEPDPVTKLQAR